MVQKYVECQLCTPPETIEPRAKFFHVKHHHPEHVEDYEEIKDEVFVEVEPPVEEEEEMPKEPDDKPEPIKVTDKTRRQQRPLYDPAGAEEERRIPHEPPRIEVGQPLTEDDLYEGTTIEYQGRKYTPEDLIFAYGLTGVKALMKEELKVALQETPKEPSGKVMSFILSQFDRHPQYSQMPQALFDLLMKVAKLEPFIAQEVVTRVFEIPDRYRSTIEIATQGHRYFTPPASWPPDPRSTAVPYGYDQVGPQTFERYHLFSGQDYYRPPRQTYEPPYRFRPPAQDGQDRLVTMTDIERMFNEFAERMRKEEETKKVIESLKEENEQLRQMVQSPRKEDDFLRSRYEKLEEEYRQLLREQNEGTVKKDDISEFAEKLRIFNETLIPMMGGGRVPEVLDERLKKIESGLSIFGSGDISENQLRLEELKLQRDIRAAESQSTREAIDRVAATIENLGSNFGHAIGEALVGRTGSRQMVVQGTHLAVICPECGGQFSENKEAEIIKCPYCQYVIWDQRVGAPTKRVTPEPGASVPHVTPPMPRPLVETETEPEKPEKVAAEETTKKFTIATDFPSRSDKTQKVQEVD